MSGCEEPAVFFRLSRRQAAVGFQTAALGLSGGPLGRCSASQVGKDGSLVCVSSDDEDVGLSAIVHLFT